MAPSGVQAGPREDAIRAAREERYPLGTRERSAGATAAEKRIPESRIAMRDPRQWS